MPRASAQGGAPRSTWWPARPGRPALVTSFLTDMNDADPAPLIADASGTTLWATGGQKSYHRLPAADLSRAVGDHLVGVPDHRAVRLCRGPRRHHRSRPPGDRHHRRARRSQPRRARVLRDHGGTPRSSSATSRPRWTSPNSVGPRTARSSTASSRRSTSRPGRSCTAGSPSITSVSTRATPTCRPVRTNRTTTSTSTRSSRHRTGRSWSRPDHTWGVYKINPADGAIPMAVRRQEDRLRDLEGRAVRLAARRPA